MVHHSRSVTDLTRINGTMDSKQPVNDNEKDRRRDGFATRRRSTLPWSGASPTIRQARLEDIAGSRMADSWFSLHCDGVLDPVYISEIVEKAMNPSFRYFDLNACGPVISRRGSVTVKYWVKTDRLPSYFLLLELQVNLRSLQYIGKSLDSFYHPLPPNCIIFHFVDGVYTNLTDVPPIERPLNPHPAGSEGSNGNQLATSTYDDLMSLANLDDCIQDASATRNKLELQINATLEDNRQHLDLLDLRSQAKERLSMVKRAVVAERTRLRQSYAQKDNIIRSLKARRSAMVEGRSSQENTQSHLSCAQDVKSSSQQLLKKTTEDSMGQIRRICEDLHSTYPIKPIAGKPLAFTIRGLPLPNSFFVDIDKESVAGALGYTAQVLYLLSFYLSVPLPYPLRPYLSNSVIEDPISLGLAQRVFPLHPVNTHYQFEYGVFLLNKDIEYLMNRLGLRVLDIRHTLPNLKYLLYILTAGTSEIPTRKAGGVRGLFGAGFSPSLSRQDSKDSLASSDTMMSTHNRMFPFNLPPSAFSGSASSTNSGAPQKSQASPTVGNGQVSVSMTTATPVIVNNSQTNRALAPVDQGGIESSV